MNKLTQKSFIRKCSQCNGYGCMKRTVLANRRDLNPSEFPAEHLLIPTWKVWAKFSSLHYYHTRKGLLLFKKKLPTTLHHKNELILSQNAGFQVTSKFILYFLAKLAEISLGSACIQSSMHKGKNRVIIHSHCGRNYFFILKSSLI